MRKEVIGAAELWLGDCREVLPALSGVDAVVTDPPYGVGYAEWDDSPVTDWLDLVPSSAVTICLTPGKKNLFAWPKPIWTASYSFPGGRNFASGGGVSCWEPVLIYRKNRLPIDARQFPPIPDAPIDWHPCPKPLVPFTWLVDGASRAGERVCDPFFGSGTTAVACVNLGRAFVGIELNEGYFDRACRRIEQAQRQADLFVSQPTPDLDAAYQRSLFAEAAE